MERIAASRSAVYDLASTLVSVDVPASPGGNATGGFVDLNGDGLFEFKTRDDSFAYTYCCFADSPAALAILEYSPAQGKYVPASYRYPDLYQDEILRHTERARARGSEESRWRMGRHRQVRRAPACSRLPVLRGPSIRVGGA